jgi:diketogulonate reductase-like aldo/keto reductase
MMSRRKFIGGLFGTWAGISFLSDKLLSKQLSPIKRTIPSSGEVLPIIGMGTSRTFDVDSNEEEIAQLARVLQVFFDRGGALIDSSPMYGSSERVLGELLKTTTNKENLFSSTKVWTYGGESGVKQMNESLKLWGLKSFDLMQIHNLRDWKVHIRTLRNWKDEGKIRYIGITTSHGRNHDEFEKIMKTEQLDVAQFSYNIEVRVAEKRLLPLAREKNIATIINRPFQRGGLFKKVRGKPLPDWASEFDCTSWAQYFLKFIASNPDVTNIIPASSNVKHTADNMAAGFGRLPDEKIRAKMVEYYARV